LAVWTIGLYIIVNKLEAKFLAPLVVGRLVGLNTFWILINILFGGVLYGIVGVFLAIPVAIIIKSC
jgi:predicted PurR-regulated permease PerM